MSGNGHILGLSEVEIAEKSHVQLNSQFFEKKY